MATSLESAEKEDRITYQRSMSTMGENLRKIGSVDPDIVFKESMTGPRPMLCVSSRKFQT